LKLVELNPKWLSSGGEGVTITATGEPAPLIEHSALDFDCPCGCGDRCCVPCEKGFGNRWHVQNDNFDFNTLTLTPSIQRTVNPSMCKTHFHITNGEITP
jgi:hypothetical protein